MSFLKQLVIVVILAGIGYGGYLGWQHYAGGAETVKESGRGGRGGPTRVEIAPAERRDMATVAEAVGSTRARRAVEITPLTTGRVTEIAFRAGQAVAAGAVLVRLDDEIQHADLVEAESRLKEAKAALARVTSLEKKSAVALSQVDTLTAALATAQAGFERARRRLRDRTIVAPFAGVVGFTRVELGARVEDGDVITTLDDLSTVEIEFALPETLFARIVPGQAVAARAGAFPGRTFVGRIETIDSRIDPVGRAFKVRALVANPDRTLPAGMFMHISVELDSRNALTVPEEAVVFDAARAYVFTVAEGEKGLRASRRDMTLGQRAFGYVEVLAGLAEGDEVVISGLQRVRDGAPVQRAGEGRGPGRDKTARGAGGDKREGKRRRPEG